MNDGLSPAAIIGVLGTAVSTLFGLLMRHLTVRIKAVEVKSDACEKDRLKLHSELGNLKREMGIAEGRADIAEVEMAKLHSCPFNECPMRPLASVLYQKKP